LGGYEVGKVGGWEAWKLGNDEAGMLRSWEAERFGGWEAFIAAAMLNCDVSKSCSYPNNPQPWHTDY
jgi:hypothetical protein